MSARPIILVAVLLLAACSAPTVPDFTWFRLPTPAPPAPAAIAPHLRAPLVVEAFGADGLYADQALIYALDPDAHQLRQYHYQLWIDPPTRLLQRRLIAVLREAHVSAEVTDELPASAQAIRVRGTLLRFDRVPVAAGGWKAVVALKLRVDTPDGKPLVDRIYRAEQAAGGDTLDATVAAHAVALDAVFTHFQDDLLRRGDQADAH